MFQSILVMLARITRRSGKSLPILQNAHMKTREGNLHFSVTDLGAGYYTLTDRGRTR